MEAGKIHICHIISGDLWAGAEAQAYTLLKGLSKKPSLQLSAITFSNGYLAKKLLDANIPVDVVDEKANNALQISRNIYRILKRRDVRIVHTHGYKETFLGGMASRLSRVKGIIRTHHGKGVIDSGAYHSLIEKLNSLFFSDALISVSEDLKRCLTDYGYQRVNIDVVHNGILTDEVRPTASSDKIKSELQIDQESIVIGTMGRMVAIKGHRYFIEGAKEVLAKHDHLVFIIAGDGPLMDGMRQEIKRFGIESKVKLIGFRNDPFNVLNIFDLFAMTSLHEGIPTVLLEAMWLGKPIIATRVGGIPEIISDGCNGLLIDPADGHAFASACLRLIDDRVLRDKLSEGARESFIGKYDVGRVAENIEKIYKRFL
ncbi:MAG: glycosyltransferase family 4 protein [Nitrospirae bacterium]|nr:glycosyltransferase family 4 protein [Candidatus Manganitrophaceae bacterium]